MTHRRIMLGTLVATGLLVATIGWRAVHQSPATVAAPASKAGVPAVAMSRPEVVTTATVVPATAFHVVTSRAGSEPNDLASYVQPGDPEPTMSAVITALRESGIRDGLAAFNPPGTSPALEGLAVPEDFELPPGYVRHHQANDDGSLIEPILMFAPDAVILDEHGQRIALPENRVVPPALAPPGLPLRWLTPGNP